MSKDVDWKKELRQIYVSIDGDDSKKAKPIIDFISSLLQQQQEKFLEIIDETKKKHFPFDDGEEIIEIQNEINKLREKVKEL